MISIKNLTFKYSKTKELFKDLNLELEAGKICGLLGKNGAGKTTLLRNMTGLLFPTHGSVYVLGQDVSKRNPEIAKEIFYVQEEYELPAMSIDLYAKIYAPFYDRFDISNFKDLLEKFEVDYSMKTQNLSYGQKKKVQIAFALSTGVKLLIMDEPTNGLDIPSKAQFRKVVISSLREDQSIVISSHQVRDLSNLLDRVVIVEDGSVVLNEDVYDISSALLFRQIQGSNVPENALYHEMIPGGFLVVQPNEGVEQSQIDLEALFNAVVTSKDKVKSIFKNQNMNKDAQL
ncbi:ABC transporter ATP-binding protein [Portibacter lacus]|uniref:ABC transporter ATP-binding protein n=1 Tax=Portibacter lacus TaxID=1099794 RepID=A0AA37SMZ2_9BACT|nr:ABC transporter ATP-binding protein [Portibacter lacus]GLR16279.1 ABC transporter ATP-binding protein [Portibacter lacus]